jgi:PAS domain S-box-containing protein
VAIGIAYFLAARLGLALRAKPGGVAVFWPAAGIAIGALIALGPSARLPVAVAVAVATIASKLIITGNPWLGVMFGLVCAGQTLLTAWLIERWFGGAFKLEDVPQVLGFLVASAAGAGMAAFGAVAAVNLVQSTASPLDVWRLWFASCLLGTVTVAPLLIGLGEAVRELPPRRELIEGAAGLVILVVLSVVLISLPQGPWATALPVALVFPLLLWVAVRCRPVFAAAATFIVALAVIWSTTFDVGHFGDSSLPLADRILAGQTLVLAGALLLLILAALFAERRRSEAALRDSNDRLQLALDGSELGVWSIDPRSGRFENDARDRRIHGHHPYAPPKSLAEARPFVHPDDLPNLDAAFAASGRTGGSYKAEYRLASVPSCADVGQERWIAVRGTVVRNAAGRPVRLLGVTHDITERKAAEERLQKSERALRELLGALPAAIYVTDAAGRITYCNQSAVDLWGQSPKLGEHRWCDFAKFYHGDGTPMALNDCPTEIALKLGKIVRGKEAILERSDGTRIPIVPYPTPLCDGKGAILGVVNMTVDISERKNAELALAERNMQLALAAKAALVGSYAYDADTEWMQVSEGYAAIYEFPEGTTSITRRQWLAKVHPEDRERLDALRLQSISNRRGEQSVVYRIVRSTGEVRWIESRSFISYGNNGRPARVIGVNIDVTERQRTDEHQRALVAELDHRVKNALATVSAVASRTQDASTSVADFAGALDGRIKSMAIAHELLSLRRWQGLPLAELVRRELAAYATSNNTEIGGPEVMLSAETGQAMAMVLHELVTNAAKYGALSTQSGRVSLRWYWRHNGNAHDRLVVEWQEMGGPDVVAPSKSGYGTTVIRELVPYELGGTVDLTLAPAGVRCRFEIPGDYLTSGGRLRDHFNGSFAQPSFADR